jgi:phosphatidylglycerophosphatase A
MTPDTEPASTVAPPRKKPHLSFLLATWFGLGYLPKAPGTFGAIVGCLVAALSVQIWPILLNLLYPSFVSKAFAERAAGWGVISPNYGPDSYYWQALVPSTIVLLLVAALGVWSAARVASYSRRKDPQYVVIDEVSGQHLTLFLALVPIHTSPIVDFDGVSSVFAWRMFHPTYLLAGFLLFRLFDIWKPFPIRHLEKLPGGWGIMADDWLAGIYAAILLRLALHFNLL